MSAIDLNQTCQKYSHCAMKNPDKQIVSKAGVRTEVPVHQSKFSNLVVNQSLSKAKPGPTAELIEVSSRPQSEPKFFDLIVDDQSIPFQKHLRLLLTRMMVFLLMTMQITQQTPGIGVNTSSAEFIIAPDSISLCIGGIALHS